MTTLNPAAGDKSLELVRNLDAGIYDDAAAAGLTVSQHMERLDPTEDAPEHAQGMDAFQRALVALDVRTRPDVVRGHPASTLGDLYAAGEGHGRYLVPEFVTRTARVAQMFGAQIGSMADPWGTYRRRFGGDTRFYQSSAPISDVLRPEYIDSMIHYEPLRASILGQMVAVDEQVADAKPYTGFFLTYDATKSRFHRITEGAPPPIYELTGADRTHQMHEFAFSLRFSYRVASEYALPLFQQHIALAMEQNSLDKEQVGYETVMLGDGSGGAATNTNITALTSGVANDVKVFNLLEWLRLFEGNGNFQPTIGVATSAVCSYLDRADFGTANHPAFFGLMGTMLGQGAMPERRTFPPVYARSYATANKVLAWDATKSLRMRYTVMINETDKLISGRMNEIVLSEYVGFSLLVDGGRRTLDVAT